MKLVINGYTIEERTDGKGNTYYTITCGNEFTKAYTLEKAIEFAKMN